MKKIIYPGSFDPPTLGHLNIILRASSLFDYVCVAVGQNGQKPSSCFSLEEKIELIRMMLPSKSNIEVIAFQGLLVDCAKAVGAEMILKSIRNFSDFEYEVQQAHVNHELSGLETLYMQADEQFRFISSSLIREIACHGKRLHKFVPQQIEEAVFNRLTIRK